MNPEYHLEHGGYGGQRKTGIFHRWRDDVSQFDHWDDPNTGSYAWTVPDSITTAARVRVSDAGNANALDISNANFKIRGSLTVATPNGAEGWPINTTQNITWTKVGSIANVKLEYSTNGFTDELQNYLIAASVIATTGTPYSWLIP